VQYTRNIHLESQDGWDDQPFDAEGEPIPVDEYMENLLALAGD